MTIFKLKGRIRYKQPSLIIPSRNYGQANLPITTNLRAAATTAQLQIPTTLLASGQSSVVTPSATLPIQTNLQGTGTYTPAIQIVQSNVAQTGSSTNTTLQVSLNTPTTAGNSLVCYITVATDDTNAVTQVPASGWKLLYSYPGDTTSTGKYYFAQFVYQYANISQGQTGPWTFTFGGTSYGIYAWGAIAEASGLGNNPNFDLVSPMATQTATPNQTGLTIAPTATSIPATNNDLALACFASDNGIQSYTLPAGWAKIGDHSGTTDFGAICLWQIPPLVDPACGLNWSNTNATNQVNGIVLCVKPGQLNPTAGMPIVNTLTATGSSSSSGSAQIGMALPAGNSNNSAESLKYLGVSPNAWTKMFIGGSTWAESINSWYYTHAWIGTKGTVWEVSITSPSEGSGITSAQIVAGTYDSYYQQQAALIMQVNPNQPNIIQIGEEVDGNWFDWGVGQGGNAYFTPAEYIAAYQHIYNIYKASPNNNFTFDFNGGSTSLGQQAYPGDSYCDHISLDSYDNTNVTTWQNEITTVANFAKAHNKPFGISEWGVGPTSSGYNGDDPTYISTMQTFMNTLAAGQNVDWYIYFNWGVNALDGFPNSASEFISLFA